MSMYVQFHMLFLHTPTNIDHRTVLLSLAFSSKIMFLSFSDYKVETDQRLCERYLIRQSELLQLRFKITDWLTKTIHIIGYERNVMVYFQPGE